MDPDAHCESPPAVIHIQITNPPDSISAFSGSLPSGDDNSRHTIPSGDDNSRQLPTHPTPSVPIISPVPMSTPSFPSQHQVDIPLLTFSNYIPWRISIEHHARMHKVLDYLLQAVPNTSIPEEAALHRDKHSQAQLLVLPSLSTEVMALFTDAELSGSVHTLFSKIHSHLTARNPENTDDNLRGKAQSIKWDSTFTVSDYVAQHNEIRALMIRANYPDISNEQTTVKFLLEGLEHHPDWTVFLQTIATHNALHPGSPLSKDHIVAMMVRHDEITKRTATVTRAAHHLLPRSVQHRHCLLYTSPSPRDS